VTQWFPQAAPTFQAALRDLDARFPESRAAAARRLADLADADEPALLAEALPRIRTLATDDPSALVRGACLEALGLLGDPGTDGPLLERRARDEPEPTAAEEAVLARARLGGPDVPEFLVALLVPSDADGDDGPAPDEVRFQAATALPAVSPARSLEVLPALLEDEREIIRGAAARALAAAGEGDVVGPDGTRRAASALHRRFEVESAPAVRRDLAFALAELGDPQGTPELIDALMTGDPATAIDAAEALGALGADEAREALARQAQRMFGNLLVRAAAAAALAQLDDPRGTDALRTVLTARRPDGRTYAVRAAGRLGLRALRPELEDLAERPRGADPDAVADALRRLDA